MFNIDDFMSMVKSEEPADSLARSVEAVREQLEEDRRGYYDERGDGTLWRFSGTYTGCGFAFGELEVRDDGLANVRVSMGVQLEPELASYAAKLFASYNAHLKTPGLAVADDGELYFESGWFDPLTQMDADVAAGRALSTVHAYASVATALRAGVEPWAMIDEDRSPYGGGDGGGRGFEAVAERLASAMAAADDPDDIDLDRLFESLDVPDLPQTLTA